MVHVSAKKQSNIEELKKKIFTMLVGEAGIWEEVGCVPNLRHKYELREAVEAAHNAYLSLGSGQTNDLVAIDLQQCLDRLANIVGETTTEDILDVIFAQFCLGK
jgi:tRNA modification GTPase